MLHGSYVFSNKINAKNCSNMCRPTCLFIGISQKPTPSSYQPGSTLRQRRSGGEREERKTNHRGDKRWQTGCMEDMARLSRGQGLRKNSWHSLRESLHGSLDTMELSSMVSDCKRSPREEEGTRGGDSRRPSPS